MAKREDQLRTYSGGVAIVTGGASGIGKALGEELAKRGCEVVLADLNAEEAKAVAESIRSHGGKATAEALDVTNAQLCARKIAEKLVLKRNERDAEQGLINIKEKMES